MIPTPSFVTLTGADQSHLLPDLVRIASTFPAKVEFGLLVASEKFGTPRFPSVETLNAFRTGKLRLSAHICGRLADRIFAGQDIDFDLSGFTRTQINLIGRHAGTDEIENAIAFGRRRGIRTILQCGGAYPTDARCDWLLDTSYGRGQPLENVPDMNRSGAFCGISGGLRHDTVDDVLRSAAPHIAGRSFWLDAETALFTQAGFSPDACLAFLETIFGTRSQGDGI